MNRLINYKNRKTEIEYQPQSRRSVMQTSSRILDMQNNTTMAECWSRSTDSYRSRSVTVPGRTAKHVNNEKQGRKVLLVLLYNQNSGYTTGPLLMATLRG